MYYGPVGRHAGGMTATLAPTTCEHRLANLRSAMESRGWAAVAVTSPECIYYLTGLDHLGYFSFTLLVVPVDGAPTILTREMERPTIRAQLGGCRHVTFADGTDAAAVAATELAGVPDGVLGVEEGSMFFPPAIRARLAAELPQRAIADATTLLTDLRAVKSASEVEHVRAAATVSDQAMQAVLRTVGVGVPERELAATAQATMYTTGGQQPGFAPLIRPLWMLDQEHVSWGDRELQAGDGLFVELSGCVRRYHAPLSRTIYLGSLPDGAAQAHGIALEGLGAAQQALRPGVPTGEVFAAWQHAVGGAVRHHCGYLVGIGFPPSWVGGGEVLGIRPGGETLVEAGMTFHLMSWVHGHVISDTALVTEDSTELLTKTPRTLTIRD